MGVVSSSCSSSSSSSSSWSLLTEIPMDVLLIILDHLNLYDHYFVSSTSRRLRDVTRTSPSRVVMNLLPDTKRDTSPLAKYQAHVTSLTGVRHWSEVTPFTRIDELEIDFTGVRMRQTPDEIGATLHTLCTTKDVKRLQVDLEGDTSTFWRRVPTLPITSITCRFRTHDQVESQFLVLPHTLGSYKVFLEFECRCIGYCGGRCGANRPFVPSSLAWSCLCSLPLLERLYITGDNWKWTPTQLGSLASFSSLTDLTLDGGTTPPPTMWSIDTPLYRVRRLTLTTINGWSSVDWESCARFIPAIHELSIRLLTYLLPPMSSWLHLTTVFIELHCRSLSMSPSWILGSSLDRTNTTHWPPRLKSLNLMFTIPSDTIRYLPQLVPHLPRSLIDLSIRNYTPFYSPYSYYSLLSPLFSAACPIEDLQLLHTNFPIHEHVEFIEFAKKRGWKLQ